MLLSEPESSHCVQDPFKLQLEEIKYIVNGWIH